MPITINQKSLSEVGPFSIQIGGLRTEKDALKFKAFLNKKGYAPYSVQVKSPHGKDVWFALRIGRYVSIDEAADAANEFMHRENIPAQAVSSLD